VVAVPNPEEAGPVVTDGPVIPVEEAKPEPLKLEDPAPAESKPKGKGGSR
jgi:hypothetical protein